MLTREWREKIDQLLADRVDTCSGCKRSYKDGEKPRGHIVKRHVVEGDLTRQIIGWACSEDCAAAAHGLFGIDLGTETN